MRHSTKQELEAGLGRILEAPSEPGRLELIVRRPTNGARETPPEARLDQSEGLVGDNWRVRGSPRTADGSAHPDMQLNVMNARVLALVAGRRERWSLAGDQLVVDMDLSHDNLPAGARLGLGSSIIEVTAQPHNGCKKFVERFGLEAAEFVNSAAGKPLRLRGLCARVVQGGVVRLGDWVHKL